MARTSHPALSDPIARLAVRPFCDYPDGDKPTPEQQFALHEFIHSVLTAGYKLYQTVPPEMAGPLIRQRFAFMIKEG
jgi:hypothetical protein